MKTSQTLITDHLDIWTAAENEKKSGRGRSSGNATSVYGIKKLRELILELAVRGKLVSQDENDEPASELLKRIQAEKAELIAEGKIKKAKPLAEITDDEKPFELPMGWQWGRFGEIAQHNSGKTLDSGRNKGTLHDYITTSNLYWGCFELANVRQMPIRDEELYKCSAKKGDLLICEGGEAGRAAVWSYEKDICFQNHIHRARFYCEIDPYYAYRFFEKLNATGEINQHRKGVGISNMSGKALASIVFPLPPLAEQHRIVAKVDELMALCDQLETQHSNAAEANEKLVSHLLGTITLSQSAEDFSDNWQRIAAHFDTLFSTEVSIDALKQTLLQLAVLGKLVAQDRHDESGLALSNRIQCSRTGKRKIIMLSEEVFPSLEGLLPSSWTWTSIDQISADDPSAITDGPFGANLKTEHYVDQPGFRVVRLQNIGHGEFRDEHRSYVEEARFEKLKKHQVYAGDLIVAGLIDTSIRCCAAPKDIGQAIVKADCYRLSVHPLVSAGYVHRYLNSIMAHEFAAVHHHGLTLTRIGLGNFRSVPIPIPPLAEQHRIVAKVDELMAICDQLKSRITKANQLQQKLADVMVEQAVN